MVFSRFRIKNKLILGALLLVVMLLVLAWSGLKGVYAYRQLVRQISQRADELPLVSSLTSSLDSLYLSLSPRLKHNSWFDYADSGGTSINAIYAGEFQLRLLDANNRARAYREQIGDGDGRGIADTRQEREIVEEIQQRLKQFDKLNENWLMEMDSLQVETTAIELEDIRRQAHRLPELMQHRMNSLHGEVRGAYRTMIVTSWASTVAAVLLLMLSLYLFNLWIFRPLRILHNGSRRVAAGEFRHRIQLKSDDEMGELASAMNDMTTRFQEIRDDLDRQVRERTQEVVQSERLASVGFLAAGVAHEINNPLAAIAMSAERLEPRVFDLLESPPEDVEDGQMEIVRKYLRRIQEEAFRCKGITERLLDFSRLGNMEQNDTDLRELTSDIIEMIQDLGTYRGKTIEFQCDQHVTAWVNSDEIKQVMLNLITNGLDSLDPSGGIVQVRVRRTEGEARIEVEDNGCGMTEEVMEHLFEPFFTRRRDGSGTGLGLSITYRIVTDHGGKIEAHSDGPGSGTTLRVTLPVRPNNDQEERKNQAA